MSADPPAGRLWPIQDGQEEFREIAAYLGVLWGGYRTSSIVGRLRRIFGGSRISRISADSPAGRLCGEGARFMANSGSSAEIRRNVRLIGATRENSGNRRPLADCVGPSGGPGSLGCSRIRPPAGPRVDWGDLMPFRDDRPKFRDDEESRRKRGALGSNAPQNLADRARARQHMVFAGISRNASDRLIRPPDTYSARWRDYTGARLECTKAGAKEPHLGEIRPESGGPDRASRCATGAPPSLIFAQSPIRRRAVPDFANYRVTGATGPAAGGTPRCTDTARDARRHISDVRPNGAWPSVREGAIAVHLAASLLVGAIRRFPNDRGGPPLGHAQMARSHRRSALR